VKISYEPGDQVMTEAYGFYVRGTVTAVQGDDAYLVDFPFLDEPESDIVGPFPFESKYLSPIPRAILKFEEGDPVVVTRGSRKGQQAFVADVVDESDLWDYDPRRRPSYLVEMDANVEYGVRVFSESSLRLGWAA
jgi:hypothetical protein